MTVEALANAPSVRPTAPGTCRRVVVARHGGPDVPEVVTGPVPTPAAGEVRVRVEAAGVSAYGEARYVAYNGAVGRQPIDWGNPRHGYRCVRAATDTAR
jgi:hypothetical protein